MIASRLDPAIGGTHEPSLHSDPGCMAPAFEPQSKRRIESRRGGRIECKIVGRQHPAPSTAVALVEEAVCAALPDHGHGVIEVACFVAHGVESDRREQSRPGVLADIDGAELSNPTHLGFRVGFEITKVDEQHIRKLSYRPPGREMVVM